MERHDFESRPNLLPYDGVVNYHGVITGSAEADSYFKKLIDNIDWQNDEVTVFGKRHVMKRQTAWYGDEPFAYTYSNATKTALPWTPELSALKSIVEKCSGESYNSCLLNLYNDGSEGMGWHSDDEKTIAKNSAIASMSFGATRRFAFKHKKSKENVSILLEHGSLLVMKGETQTHWLHSIPKSVKVKDLRINLTFRTFQQ
ncbi:MAG: alpha-ketoglutarate-dependent dioxygenase AlkB [Flavobacterium sp.]|nr:MAG: alpha-ketoglutarate-dependent dioxygenase AlkB [Flavobacterium sp.]